MNKLQRAHLVALVAHEGQFRKYNNVPYVIHCLNVYHIVADYTKNEDVWAAALLHDTVEDTNVTQTLLTTLFGGQVSHLVYELTNVFTSASYPDKNREERFKMELDRLATISSDAQTIKYADLIDNTNDIVKHDKDFASVYLSEKWRVLQALDKGDPRLRLRAIDQVKGLMN